MINKLIYPLLFLMALTWVACENENEDTSTDEFDRQTMLVNWADNIIVPAYTELATSTEQLKQAAETFEQSPTNEHLAQLRNAHQGAYLTWQRASMFVIGKAEELLLRDNCNLYPTNVEGIESNIASNDYNLELPSQRDHQGFPALDYLLYGVADTDEAILTIYLDLNGGEDYRDYIVAIAQRMDELVDAVLASWVSGYRDEFVASDGNSATASVDRMVNDYLFYYEKALRAGKVGIPAGRFSTFPKPGHVEALYQRNGKVYLQEAVDAAQSFFNGGNGIGLSDYLAELDTEKDGQPLADLINAQFEAAKTEIAKLDADLSAQVETDNTLMLRAYDELQKNVVLLKVDMLQAMNINVDFVDADGD